MKSAVGLASVALVVSQASLAAAAPSCSREASQLTVVFSEECTQWYHSSDRGNGQMPEQCNQVGRGLVSRGEGGKGGNDTVPRCICTSEYCGEQVFVLFLCFYGQLAVHIPLVREQHVLT